MPLSESLEIAGVIAIMSVSKELRNRKRKLERSENETEEEEEIKKILLDVLSDEATKPNLLNLADEVLLEIALHLDGESLHNISL